VGTQTTSEGRLDDDAADLAGGTDDEDRSGPDMLMFLS